MREHFIGLDDAPPHDASSLATVLQGLQLTAGILADPGAGVSGAGRPSGVPLLPEEPQDRGKVLAELGRVAGQAVRVGRPGWMGHMDPPPTWSSVLGAAAAALLNNNLLMREMSPSLTTLEEELTCGFAMELGLGPEARGTMAAGGSVANLLALTVARNERLERLGQEVGSRYDALSRLTVVASADAHVSIRRAAMILGLDPAAGVLHVDPDERGRLDPERVTEAVTSAQDAGRICFAIVGTAGTTILGAIDPLGPLASVAKAVGAWYHVDAAYAGALALSRRKRKLLTGLDRADSVTVNPQKWLYVAKVAALALFRDGGTWSRAMGGPLPYALPDIEGMRPAARIEGTRGGDVLKLHLSLQQLGRRGYEELFEHGFTLAAKMEAHIRRRPFLELAVPPATNIVVFRFGAGDADSAARLTHDLHRRLTESQDLRLSLPVYRGKRWLRSVLLNPFTGAETIERLFTEIDAFAEERAVEE